MIAAGRWMLYEPSVLGLSPGPWLGRYYLRRKHLAAQRLPVGGFSTSIQRGPVAWTSRMWYVDIPRRDSS